MPWNNPSDREALTILFDLPIAQSASNSQLDQCMTALEKFDTDNGTTYVVRVQALLAQTQAIDDQITAYMPGLTFQSFTGEGSQSYNPKSLELLNAKRDQLRAKIKKLLNCSALSTQRTTPTLARTTKT